MNYYRLLKFADEFLEKLKKPLGKRDENEELLLKHNIVPIEFGGTDSSFIDGGSFSKVYHVIFNGKSAVAKITEEDRDIYNIEKFHELLNNIPDKFKKYIPYVYKIIYTKNHENKDIYIAIVEKLIPLSKNIENIFRGNFDKNTFKYKVDVIKSKLKHFLKELFEDYSELFEGYNINYNDIYNYLIKELEYLKVDNEESAMATFTKHKDNFFNYLSNLTNNRIANIIVYGSYDVFVYNKLFIGYPFPKAYQYYKSDIYSEFSNFNLRLNTKLFRIYPETKGLFEFLLYLKKQFGIEWEDVRHVNVMMRPSTKDLVISDPGLFRYL